MKRWAKRQLERDESALNGSGESAEEIKLAVEVARLYGMILKLKHPYVRIMQPGKPVAQTRWWSHFVATARVIAELKADPRMYLQAQFDRLAWKKGAYPYPTQLHSDTALVAYVERQGRYVEKRYRADVTNTAVIYDQREERKLLTWASRLGVSTKRVLKDHPNEFTKAFHESKGTWIAVREEFAE